MDDGAGFAGIAAALAAVAAVVVPLTAFWHRPQLAIVEDVEAIRSRVQGNGLPYVRLLVTNQKRRVPRTGLACSSTTIASSASAHRRSRWAARRSAGRVP